MKELLSKNPARRQTKTELYGSTVPTRQQHHKRFSLTPEQAVGVFGSDILDTVVLNLCEQYLTRFRLADQISKLERIIPTLPVITHEISLRGLYEAMLPRLRQDHQRCRRHIQYLGRCYDLLHGTALFTPKPVSGRVDVTALKERADIASVISQDIELRPAGRTFKARCPFHEDRTPSFVVYPETGRWWCFGACNDGGDVINYIQRARDCGFREAIAELKRL